MRIIAVHLLNDFSGSPKVLMQALKTFTKNNIETHLFTSNKRVGFLSNIYKVNNHFFTYYFSENKIIRILFYLFSQFILFFKLAFFLKKTDVVYVNTVLPFGASCSAKFKGCKVIYHIHETSIKPKILKSFLFNIIKITATDIIYVSRFLANQEVLHLKKSIVYNVLESSFVEIANKNNTIEKKEKIVLMICSLKKYKGVDEFLQLAVINPSFIFKLVLNATPKEIDSYFNTQNIPNNLLIYPSQKNTHPFYEEASIILNLSDANLWIESFGLTILEGMAYKLPAIVPLVGGVIELVEENKNGFLIDSKNIIGISEKINLLFSDKELYEEMQFNAIEKSKLFSEVHFEESILKIFSKYN
jgi:glycosyltransferase involved in cell wall biosynthesis